MWRSIGVRPLHPPRRCTISLIRLAGILTCAGTLLAQGLPTLTRAQQVRELGPQDAAKGYPVRIRGVITDAVPSPDYFIQDSTAGIYVEGVRNVNWKHPLGSLVEITGVTGPGHFAPVIRERSIQILGQGRFPSAKLYSLNELLTGQMDSQWAKIRGIVRSAIVDRKSWSEPTLALTIAAGAGQFKSRTPLDAPLDPTNWIGREVLIEGVCGSLFNDERQLMGILFYVPRLELIKLETPAQPVPFTSVLRFSPEQKLGTRVRVRGVVSYQQPGVALYLQDGNKGLRVLTTGEATARPGDVVDAVGFPTVGDSAPVLEDAIFDVVGHGGDPRPVDLPTETPPVTMDGSLVRLQGTLLNLHRETEGTVFTIKHGNAVFDAFLAGALPKDEAPHVNSIVQLTGVCLVRSGGMWRTPVSFRVLLRSPADVKVVRAPSWWNLRSAMWALALMVIALVAAMLVAAYLARKVRDQMRIIQHRLRTSAILEERNRIARELHDTLEQELAGITMQLDLAADRFHEDPAIAERAVDVARTMSRRSMVDARQSVWDLRCDVLESGDLVAAVREAVTNLPRRHSCEISVNVEGEPRRFPSETVAPHSVQLNVLRIAQEAVANALKHAHPKHIEIAFRYSAVDFTLAVADDGCGFELEESAFAGTGHFGLLDMRERANAIGGALTIDSTSGAGTRLTVRIPVAETTAENHARLEANSVASGR